MCPLNMPYSLNILNIHIISPILIYVSVISNNKKYELKLLWETYQTTREREQVGMEGSKKYLSGRRKLLEECLLQVKKWTNDMHFHFINGEGVIRSIAPGGLAQHTPHMRTCTLCSTCALPYAYADQKWLLLYV